MTVLLLTLAGGLGAAVRHAVDALLGTGAASRLPWATLLVNLTGSFAMGLLVGSRADHELTLVLGSGFLGGYTTFSAASLHAAQAVTHHRRLDALGVATAMVVGCVLAAWAGTWLTG